MIRHLILLATFFCFCRSYAQLTLSFSTVAASCPSTGSITVNVNGGTPNYTYSITANSSCLPAAVPPVVKPGTSHTFSTLSGGCTYTVTVSSQNGQSASQAVTVADIYPAMFAPVLDTFMGSRLNCSYLKATAVGGRAPYTYTFYSGTSATNPAAIVQTGSSNILQLAGLSAGYYTVKVKDACNTERVTTNQTGSFITPDVSVSASWRPECNELRFLLALDSFYAGITVNVLDKNGVPISGTTPGTGFSYAYPYTLPNMSLQANHPWGETNVVPRTGYRRYDLPVPANPALFPITFRVTDNGPCADVINLPAAYPFPAASTAYPQVLIYNESCNGTICARIALERDEQILENYNYSLKLSGSAGGVFVPVGTITNNNFTDVCNLQPNTTYYLRLNDPCTTRDTTVAFTTPLLTPFTVTSSIISYCINPASPAYLATVLFNYTNSNGASTYQQISGPGAPRTLNNTLLSGLVPGSYSFRFTDNCGNRTQDINLSIAGTYSANFNTAIDVASTCVNHCIRTVATGTASGSLVPNGNIANFFSRLFTISGSPAPPAGQLHTGTYNVCVSLPGTYVVQTSPFFPGITCLTPRSDTIVIPAYNLPVLNRLYNVRCGTVNNIVVPLPANPDTGFVFTLINSGGTVVAGPQSLNGNPSTVPPTSASSTPNVFNNIAGSPGDVFSVKISDRCGNSATSPLTLNNDVVITGAVKCGVISGGNVITDTLRADLLPGATYTWTSPSNIIYGPSANPNYNSVPAENGVWKLDASLTINGCTKNFHSEFTVSCSVVPVRYESIGIRKAECGVTVEWVTAQETNSRDFEIQVKDNSVFKTIATMPAAGFSGTSKKYSASISLPAGAAYIRIKQNDADGRSQYTEVLKAEVSCAAGSMSIFPNPAGPGDDAHAIINIRNASAFRMVIRDAAGRAVAVQHGNLADGSTLIRIPLKGIAPGIYRIELRDRNTEKLIGNAPLIITARK